MINSKFNSEIAADIVSLETEQIAKMDTEEGLSSHKKFVLVALPKYKGQYSTIIFQNVTDNEKEQLFDMLDKELHEQTYTDIEEQLDKVYFENERLKEELAEVERFI